jgi:hypothetical protein
VSILKGQSHASLYCRAMVTGKRFVVVLGAVVLTASAAGCGRPKPPDGATALRQSMQAFQAVTLFTLVQTTTTDLGVFTVTTEVDCAAPYYRRLDTEVLTQKGIDSGTSLMQGRPRQKREEENLFVEGRSFSRFSGSWESAPAEMDNARPDWGPSSRSYDPGADCKKFSEGKAPGLPFDKMQAATKADYRGQRTVDGAQCHEFMVTFNDLVLADTLKIVDEGGGLTSSEREEVIRPVDATVCFGVTDSLPYQGASGNKTIAFRYKPFQKRGIP